MKKISLFTAAVLIAGSSVTHAALTNFNYIHTGSIITYTFPFGVITGSGTAVLDDSSDTLTLDGSYLLEAAGALNSIYPADIVFRGSVVNGIFTATTGEYIQPCPQGLACAAVVLDIPYDTVSGSLSPMGGVITATDIDNLTSTTTNLSFTFSYVSGGPISSVPVPAAAWLFGSAILGMTALKRRRK